MKQYKPVGLTNMDEDLPRFIVKNLNAISAVINNINTTDYINIFHIDIENFHITSATNMKFSIIPIFSSRKTD